MKARPIKRLEDDGEWLVELIYEGDLFNILHKVGNIPLPPYIERKLKTEEIKQFDLERYQTVYAKDEGSVAAPTAGLHFTQDILEKLKNTTLPVMPIEKLLEKAYEITGKPKKVEFSKEPIGVVVYRDGTAIDTIYKV